MKATSGTLSTRFETIVHAGKTLCVIIPADPTPEETTFYTPHEFNLQVGKVVYPAGSAIARHQHPHVPRTVSGTTEVLFVQEGHMIVDLYSDSHDFICSREVGRGDLLVLVSGGHGFHLLEHTVLIEVKQGPYGGVHDKEVF